MDAQTLTLDDGRFDAAYCLFAFMFFPDRPKAFAELKRVLKPGGRALMGTWAPLEQRPMMKVLFDAVAEAMPDVPRPSKGDLQTPEECAAEFSAAGFRDVHVVSFTGSTRVDSAERYLNLSTRAAAPFAMMRKRLGEQGWAAAEARLLEAVRKRIPPEGTTLTAEALFTIGTR
jgi:SAM-dependent methyltransferase